MAEDKIEGRERTWQSLMPWTLLFRGFQLALDLNKLLLAAAGIVVMWLGWALLATIFGLPYGLQPEWSSFPKKSEDPAQNYNAFKQARQEWNLMHEAAGAGEFAPNEDTKWRSEDIAGSLKEYNTVISVKLPTTPGDPRAKYQLTDKSLIAAKEAGVPEAVLAKLQTKRAAEAPNLQELPSLKDEVFASRDDFVKALAARLDRDELKANQDKVLSNLFVWRPISDHADYDAWVASLDPKDAKAFREVAPLYAKLGLPKSEAGRLSTTPWSENRGPNPFLLVTGQSGVPWEAGHFWDWFARDQAPVMIEPLIKVLRPIISFFDSRGTAYTKFYFILVMLWTIATWAFFGGAITRIAAVQATRGEKIGALEALRFVRKRWLSYLMAPIFPLLFMAALTILMVLFGVVVMIPFVGDIVAGFFWVGLLVLGLIMAVVLVGLVGWPLMSATISTEGTDSWEAVSRSYSYVYQKPWQYIWYSLVSICYGAVLVFFVGFMGSLTAYLSKWGVAQTPFISAANREPSFLFAYAPTSFGWRALLMQGAKTPPTADPPSAEIVQGGIVKSDAYKAYLSSDDWHWWNTIGAGLMAAWLGLLFLLVLGFGYSYFWTAGTLIYLLMRRSVDAAEMDEVYLEEEEHEGTHPLPAAPPGAIKSGPPVTMVEAPALRPAPVPTPAPAPVPTPAAVPATVPVHIDKPAPPEPASPTAPEPPPAAAPEGGTAEPHP